MTGILLRPVLFVCHKAIPVVKEATLTESAHKENLAQVLERHPNVLDNLDQKSMIQAAKEKKYVRTEKRY